MQKIGSADGADCYGVFGYPVGAPLGQGLLEQCVIGFQASFSEFERLGFAGAWVQVLNRRRVSEEELDAASLVQLVGQQFVAIDGEISRRQVEGVGATEVEPEVVDNGGYLIVQDAVL